MNHDLMTQRFQQAHERRACCARIDTRTGHDTGGCTRWIVLVGLYSLLLAQVPLSTSAKRASSRTTSQTTYGQTTTNVTATLHPGYAVEIFPGSSGSRPSSREWAPTFSLVPFTGPDKGGTWVRLRSRNNNWMFLSFQS